MNQKILQFLQARDRAAARQDWGIVRSTTADLRRWGVSDSATLANPSGAATAGRTDETGVSVAVEERPQPNRGGRPKLPRCEHDEIATRCRICNEDEAA